MPTPARTPAAGSARPVWPSRSTGEDASRAPQRVDGRQPARPSGAEQGPVRTRPGAPAVRPQPAAPVVPPAGGAERPPQVPVADVPVQEQPLDPRSIARASLAAGRNRSLWWTLAGITTAVGVAFLTDAVVGSVVLGLLLLVYAVVRAVGRPPGPAAVSVRSRRIDVAMLVTGGVALIGLASVLPPG